MSEPLTIEHEDLVEMIVSEVENLDEGASIILRDQPMDLDRHLGLKSIETVRFIIALEERFEINIIDSGYGIDDFRSIGSTVRVISELLRAGKPSTA